MAGKVDMEAIIRLATAAEEMLRESRKEQESEEDKEARREIIKSIAGENRNPVVSGTQAICSCSMEAERTVSIISWVSGFSNRNGKKGLKDVDTKMFPEGFGICRKASMPCIPLILDCIWQGCDWGDMIDGRPSVTMNSYMICIRGSGMITLVKHGQEPGSGEGLAMGISS